jgi:bis(5'-nucleosyl)-tetraphosphatase (symmetrical)
MIHLVGDLQGCCDAFDRLLLDIGFSPSRDRVVVLGDLVNRGLQSLKVLRRLRDLGDAATCLLGNHDLHLLAVAHGVRKPHRSDTVQDILDAPDRHELIDWVRTRPLASVEAGWLCVHAGVVPSWTTAQTLQLAGEVQAQLAGPDLPGLLRVMYGNAPSRWQDDLQGAERWRFVINSLTRIRFCRADGEMEFNAKDGADAAPAGFMPWFEVPLRATREQPMAFGHWSTLGLINEPTLLALDTGCVWGGPLTAVRVDGGRREVTQVPCTAARTPGID